MSTIDDKASELEEAFRDLALREHALTAGRQRLIATGECLMCGETELPEGSPFFCCVECRDDYQAKQHARRIAGNAY